MQERRTASRTAVWLSFATLLFSLVCAGDARADIAWGSLRFDWDANPEATVAGYIVYYRSENNEDRGVIRTTTNPSVLVDGLRMGQRYFLTVRAFNEAGLLGPPSTEVNAVVVQRMEGFTPFDGLPRGEGQLSYFAEGADGTFTYRLALLNTNEDGSTVTVTYLREGAAPIAKEYPIAGHSRATISSSDIKELKGSSFAAVISSAPGIVAERTMGWDAGGLMNGAHTAKALLDPSTTWYLAEGNAGYFDTFVLLANPNPAATEARVSFLTQDGEVIDKTYPLGGNQRLTIYTNELPELRFASFATTVKSDDPILVERAMYFRGPDPMFRGGHASAGVTAGAKHWFLAEGHTGSLFDMFVLIANPNTKAVKATVRYLTPNGVARTDELTLPPTSRTTILVDDLKGLEDTDVSCDITANANVIVERSMYWPGGGPWYEAHNSVGLSEIGTEWALAEGEVGGPGAAESFILLANPGSKPADVTLTFYREGARAPLTLTRYVAANSRITVPASKAGFASGERFGAMITSTQPIAVERSVYWNSGGVLWGSGTNETGTLLK
jgi:hypothetical protein